MLDRTEELEAFKCRINLIEYAASFGYILDRKASSRSSAVMTHPNGDKVIVARDNDGHWIYFSVRNDEDNGSIVDFIQGRRNGSSLGDVRRELRPLLDASRPPALPDPQSYATILEPASRDLLRVQARYEAMRRLEGHHLYLETERLIPAEVLIHPRFFDRIRIDNYGNAIFPHWNLSGLSGFEIKNHEFTGFAPGGEKGLWASHTEAKDMALVIAETAIDALSHFALKRQEATRYVSTAGTLNPSQPELIRRAADKLPDGARVILATDNDAGGDTLAESLRDLLSPVATRLQIIEDRPALRGTDWNDALKGSSRAG